MAGVQDITALTVADRNVLHSNLLTLTSQDYKTNDDGTYEIYVIPGEYDLMIDKAGYLDHIYVLDELYEGDVKEIAQKTLLAGDVDKDGTINQTDIAILKSIYNNIEGNPLYDNNTQCDFDESKSINQTDVAIALSNYLKIIQVEQV